ncbi:MAG: aminotransferase class IV [Henriciella sp.]|nr:aminotransferase class IV [Henriciella sp.]
MIILQQTSGTDPKQAFDLSDRGLLLADGVFSTALVTHGKMMFREAHLDRLCHDAAALEIHIERDRIEATLDELFEGRPSGALRVTITRGPGGRGLAGGEQAPTLMARLSDYDTSRIGQPVKLALSTLTRDPGSITARHKTLSYTDNVLAVRRAAKAGADDALLLNPTGTVACAASANLFARFGTTLVTPPVEDGALPGIVRHFILEQAQSAGFEAEVRSLSLQTLRSADQLFVTNSLRWIAPVVEFDGTRFDPSPLDALNEPLQRAQRGDL